MTGEIGTGVKVTGMMATGVQRSVICCFNPETGAK